MERDNVEYLEKMEMLEIGTLPTVDELLCQPILRAIPIYSDEEEFLGEKRVWVQGKAEDIGTGSIDPDPDPGLWYNDFSIDQCDYILDAMGTGTLRLGAAIIMKQMCRNMKLEVFVKIKSTGREFLLQTAERASGAELGCYIVRGIKNGDPKDLMMVARAEWFDGQGRKHSVIISNASIGRSGEEYVERYQHAWPKKERKLIFFDLNPAYNIPEYETEIPPVPPFDINNRGSYVTVALYRTPEDQRDCDYVCRFEKKPGTAYPYIGIPLCGTVTLKPGYRFDEFTKESVCKIVKKTVSGGVLTGSGVKLLASGEKSYEDIGFQFQYSKDRRQGTFTLVTPWKDYLMEPASWSKTFYDILVQLRMKINGQTETFTIQATSLQEIPCMRNTLFPISLMYGCLAADSRIIMADGSERRIDQIRIGDCVADARTGSAVKVCNVWRGLEQSMICMTGESGCRLTLTEQHPVQLERGCVRASEVLPQDMALMADGRTERISALEKIDYDDEVYNLDLERLEGSSGLLIAEGFAVGDNILQNQQI